MKFILFEKQLLNVQTKSAIRAQTKKYEFSNG